MQGQGQSPASQPQRSGYGTGSGMTIYSAGPAACYTSHFYQPGTYNVNMNFGVRSTSTPGQTGLGSPRAQISAPAAPVPGEFKQPPPPSSMPPSSQTAPGSPTSLPRQSP